MTEEGPCAEVIVVGLGIAGSALAYSLANQGRKVLAFERDMSEPDKVFSFFFFSFFFSFFLILG